MHTSRHFDYFEIYLEKNIGYLLIVVTLAFIHSIQKLLCKANQQYKKVCLEFVSVSTPMEDQRQVSAASSHLILTELHLIYTRPNLSESTTFND